jgi:hypothetical protein
MSSALDLGSIETAGGDVGSEEVSLTVPCPLGDTTDASTLTLFYKPGSSFRGGNHDCEITDRGLGVGIMIVRLRTEV